MTLKYVQTLAIILSLVNHDTVFGLNDTHATLIYDQQTKLLGPNCETAGLEEMSCSGPETSIILSSDAGMRARGNGNRYYHQLYIRNVKYLRLMPACINSVHIIYARLLNSLPGKSTNKCRYRLHLDYSNCYDLSYGFHTMFLSRANVTKMSPRNINYAQISTSRITEITGAEFFRFSSTFNTIKSIDDLSILKNGEIKSCEVKEANNIKFKGEYFTIKSSNITFRDEGLKIYEGNIDIIQSFLDINNATFTALAGVNITIKNTTIVAPDCKKNFKFGSNVLLTVENITFNNIYPGNAAFYKCINLHNYADEQGQVVSPDDESCKTDNMDDNLQSTTNINCSFNSNQTGVIFRPSEFLNKLPNLETVHMVKAKFLAMEDACGLELFLDQINGGIRKMNNSTDGSLCGKTNFKSGIQISNSILDLGVQMENLKKLTIANSTMPIINLTYPLEEIKLIHVNVTFLTHMVIGANATAVFNETNIHVVRNLTIQSPIKFMNSNIYRFENLTIDAKDKLVDISSLDQVEDIFEESIYIRSGTLRISEKLLENIQKNEEHIIINIGDDGILEVASDELINSRIKYGFGYKVISAKNMNQVQTINFKLDNKEHLIELLEENFKLDGAVQVPSTNYHCRKSCVQWWCGGITCNFSNTTNETVIIKTPDEYKEFLTLVGADNVIFEKTCSVDKVTIKYSSNISTVESLNYHKGENCHPFLELVTSNALEISRNIYGLRIYNSSVATISSLNELNGFRIRESNVTSIKDVRCSTDYYTENYFEDCNIGNISKIYSVNTFAIIRTKIDVIYSSGITFTYTTTKSMENNIRKCHIRTIKTHGIILLNGTLDISDNVIEHLDDYAFIVFNGKLTLNNNVIKRGNSKKIASIIGEGEIIKENVKVLYDTANDNKETVTSFTSANTQKITQDEIFTSTQSKRKDERNTTINGEQNTSIKQQKESGFLAELQEYMDIFHYIFIVAGILMGLFIIVAAYLVVHQLIRYIKKQQLFSSIIDYKRHADNVELVEGPIPNTTNDIMVP